MFQFNKMHDFRCCASSLDHGYKNRSVPSLPHSLSHSNSERWYSYLRSLLCWQHPLLVRNGRFTCYRLICLVLLYSKGIHVNPMCMHSMAKLGDAFQRPAVHTVCTYRVYVKAMQLMLNAVSRHRQPLQVVFSSKDTGQITMSYFLSRWTVWKLC